MKHLHVFALLVGLGCGRDAGPARELPSSTVRVAAASDLTRAFEALRPDFERASKQRLELSFGASGLLSKQLAAGAPFDVFASASAAFIDALIAKGACQAETRAAYARGHLVAWSKPGVVAPARALADLGDARFRRIAIANPEHAPYGKAAKEALIAAGLWSTVEPRIVYAENIQQTMQYAQSGNVDAALVALSLVIGAEAEAYLRIDERLHAPIEQTLAVCVHGENREGGRAFAAFVNSPAGRQQMRRFGLLLPGETLATR
jgi:molybdate transport system substrate-binding protein